MQKISLSGPWATLASLLCSGCFWAAPSKGGGEIDTVARVRRIETADVAVPEGFTVDVVATGLTFPTSVTFDAAGNLYVTESGYAYGEKFRFARLLRLDQGR